MAKSTKAAAGSATGQAAPTLGTRENPWAFEVKELKDEVL